MMLVGAGAPTSAQDYPDRPVKIIVPFGAGGPADIYARFIGVHLQEALKQSLVIEDCPGAGAIIGTGEVAKSAPDGYTLLMMSNTHTTNETLLPNKPFQLMRDFVPVATVNSSDLIMVVHPSVPAKDLKEFIALLKAKPGDLNYASSGPGTPYHMAGELFKAMSGTNIVHVAHRGSGDARTAVMGGHVQMMIDAITTTAPTVQEGQVRALGTTGLKRSSVLPDVPTIAEAGVPGYDTPSWFAFFLPAKTPPEVIRKIQADTVAVMAELAIKAKLDALGVVIVGSTPVALATHLKQEMDKWGPVIKAANIKVNE
jgi:tripartite-type tricarboxylate transporter receptor subunit TctC